MKKVVAFLEQYAEWVALGLGCVFLLYMIYAYVLSPDDLKVAVGSEKLMPGEVDPKINQNAVANLQRMLDAPPGDVAKLFPVKDFAAEFAKAMGPTRDRMTPEYLAGGSPRPGIPAELQADPGTIVRGVDIQEVPAIPAPVVKLAATGNSLIDPPANAAAGAAAAAAPVPAPPAGAVGANLANAADLNWVTVEFRLDHKAMVDAWTKVFFDPKAKKLMAGIPQQALLTQFLLCEVEREEQIAPGQWGKPETLKPLPLVQMEPFPAANGTPEEKAAYDIWSKTHQVDIVEPAFYPILHGDAWYTPSEGAPKAADKDPAAAAAQAKEPFDPANPPKRELTSQEKMQVYIYKKKIEAEKQKAEAQARKSKLDSAESARKAKSGTGGDGGTGTGTGGRRIGGYAPLPIQLAAGPEFDDGGRPIIRRRDGTIVRPSMAGPARDDGGRPIAPGRDVRPGVDPQTANPVLAGPFDPTALPLLDAKGNPADVKLWAHDETAVPGKTYRYKMRVVMKNPLYSTFGLTKNPKLIDQFALTSPWSAPLVVNVPPTVQYFFTEYKGSFGNRLVSTIKVEVFKHERGDWYKESWSVAPGDGIGVLKKDVVVAAGNKKDIDFSTGATLVDLRPDTKEKDVRIMVADETGNIDLISLAAQKDDPWYIELKAKAEATKAAAAAAANATPALINEVSRR